MPALFIGHGSPVNALVTNKWTEDWKALGESLPRPRAIVAISAHWYTDGTGVTAVSTPRTIHDFGGFPRALFEIQYPAPGDPDLASDLTEILAPTPVVLDSYWGLDHGTWSVLVRMFPKADVPVVQLASTGPRRRRPIARSANDWRRFATRASFSSAAATSFITSAPVSAIRPRNMTGRSGSTRRCASSR